MKLVLSLLLTCILLAAGGAAYGIHLYKKPAHRDQSETILIERGSGTKQIASQLESQNLIANKWVFLAAVRAQGRNANLKAGEYEITAQASMADIIRQLHDGKVIERKVTIPEGRTSFEIVRILNTLTDIKGDKITDIPDEGTLLPDTYHYTSSETRADKIAQMKQAMEDVKAELWEGRQKDLPFTTWEDAITLASIVEKETGVAHERKTIAGVFINRLRTGMALQSDPTVIYAITKGEHKNDGQGPLGRRLLSKDLQMDSAYNTYKNAGLPPGPIANPGKDAIEAVLHPEANDFLYFVADGTGGHVFAKTLAEHNKNVAEWRKVRRQKSSKIE